MCVRVCVCDVKPCPAGRGLHRETVPAQQYLRMACQLKLLDVDQPDMSMIEVTHILYYNSHNSKCNHILYQGQRYIYREV